MTLMTLTTLHDNPHTTAVYENISHLFDCLSSDEQLTSESINEILQEIMDDESYPLPEWSDDSLAILHSGLKLVMDEFGADPAVYADHRDSIRLRCDGIFTTIQQNTISQIETILDAEQHSESHYQQLENLISSMIHNNTLGLLKERFAHQWSIMQDTSAELRESLSTRYTALSTHTKRTAQIISLGLLLSLAGPDDLHLSSPTLGATHLMMSDAERDDYRESISQHYNNHHEDVPRMQDTIPASTDIPETHSTEHIEMNTTKDLSTVKENPTTKKKREITPSSDYGHTTSLSSPSLREKTVPDISINSKSTTTRRPVADTPLTLPTIPYQTVSSIHLDNGTQFLLKQDPTGVSYITIEAGGPTLSQAHQKLASLPGYEYLQDKSYHPSDKGNIRGRNIPATKVIAGDTIPVPLDRTQTILSREDNLRLIQSINDAMDIIQQSDYKDFFNSLQKKVGRNHMKKLMIAFAHKESDAGATSLYRNEPAYRAYSYSIYHILAEKAADGSSGPGLRALEKLGYSPSDVMADPAKAGARFRGYWKEKTDELARLRIGKNSSSWTKERKKLAQDLGKLFGTDSLTKLGHIYNGRASYGVQLKAKFDNIGKKKK